MTDSGLIVAVVGAGPAGIFASKQLAAYGHEVVLINKDIKPGGLAEYGIYFSKHKMKEGLRKQFHAILADPKIHYFGNSEVGDHADLPLRQLQEMGFNAILIAAGAQAANALGIPGENLAGVYHAKDVVYHYNLLPPFSRISINIGKRVAIVGAGNVMMDLAHWLIDEKKVDEVITVVRRGPAEVKFDKKELEGVIANMDMHALKQEIDKASLLMISMGQDPAQALAYYQDALEKSVPRVSTTRFTLRFLSSPVNLIGDENGAVETLILEENTLECVDGVTRSKGTGRLQELDVDTVILAIGDRVDEKLGLPVIDNRFVSNPEPSYPLEGISYEIFDPDSAQPIKGIFLAGWSRQASTGLVGTARKDAANAVEAIQSYLFAEGHPSARVPVEILTRLEQLLPHRVNLADILRLEHFEQQQAAQLGLEEYKFDNNEDMLAVIRAA